MLDLVHVSKTFNPGTVNEKKALDDVSLHLEKGDFVTLIGSNGAGKSTLMAAVAGEFYPDEGRVMLDGRDVTFVPDHKRARQIGRLFQDPLKGTAPHMTIEENMALAYLRAAKRGGVFSTIRAKDRAAFRQQLAALGLGLEDRLSQPVGLLSGGQRQALTLLMATLVTPKLLLLDEPAASLDPDAMQEMYGLLEELNRKEKITVIMVSHDIPAAVAYASHILHVGKEPLFFGSKEDYVKSETGKKYFNGTGGERHD